MVFDELLRRYFAVADISALTSGVLSAGVEHMLVDLGLEHDPGKHFALWSLLHLLGAAPDLDVTFKVEADREAARNFMDMMAAAEQDRGQ